MTEQRRTLAIAVCGADEQQQLLAKELKHRFKPSAVTLISSPEQLKAPVNYLVLPLKGTELLKDQTGNWLKTIDPNTKLFVGKTTGEFLTSCKKQKIDVISYIEKKEFKIANAVPTAEGAIKLYMDLSRQTVAESRMLVLGYGHCGKALSLRLKALGACVSVFARNYEDRIAGKTLGLDMRDYKEFSKLAKQKTCIFNTVPEQILKASILGSIPKTSLIIDLASLPGGTDFELCKELQITAVHALSLPGRYFPVTAGIILADTIVNMINEALSTA